MKPQRRRFNYLKKEEEENSLYVFIINLTTVVHVPCRNEWWSSSPPDVHHHIICGETGRRRRCARTKQQVLRCFTDVTNYKKTSRQKRLGNVSWGKNLPRVIEKEPNLIVFNWEQEDREEDDDEIWHKKKKKNAQLWEMGEPTTLQ